MRDELINFVDWMKDDADSLSQYSEALIRQSIVQQMFGILGWDIYRELIPEYPVQGGRVDFAVKRGGVLRIFVEAKPPSVDLESGEEQLLRYAFQEGIPLGILTNGLVWWLYLPTASGSWKERRFYAIDILEQDSASVANNLIRFLESERVVSGEAKHSAEEYLRSRQRQAALRETLPEAWNRVVAQSDERLVDILTEVTETMCGYRPDREMVEGFIRKVGVQLPVAPLPKPPPRKIVRPKKRVPRHEDYTGKQPTGYSLEGMTFEVDSWKDLLLHLCKRLYYRDPNRFVEVAPSVRGPQTLWFSRNRNDFANPERSEEIANSGIYAGTCISAQAAVSRCKKLVKGFDPDLIHTFEVHTAEGS